MNLWNLRAPIYDFFRKPWPLNIILKKETKHVQELLANVNPGGSIALDIGCGIGHSVTFLPGAWQVFAFDKSLQMAKRARRSGLKNVAVADAEFLPVKDDSANVILAIGLTEYLRSLQHFFAEIRRVGKNSSLLLCTSSPPGIFSMLRNIGGSKIYQRASVKVIETAQDAGNSLLSQRHFFTQDAFLFQIFKKNPLEAPKSDAGLLPPLQGNRR